MFLCNYKAKNLIPPLTHSVFSGKIAFLTALILINSLCVFAQDASLQDMIWVEGGSFQMGQNGDGTVDNVTSVHTVTLSGFYIGKYEVTQEQYIAVMGANPSSFTANADAGEIQNRRPVEMVSWYDALVFCNKLSITEGLTPAYRISGKTDPAAWGKTPVTGNAVWNAVTMVSGSTGYRLPTEAQWEYAAKGGSSAYNTYKIYSGGDTIDDMAWYSGNSNYKTHEVGKKEPNELGIYDMSGNVYEWCWDRVGDYSSTAETDPIGAPAGFSVRVSRGGGWNTSAMYVRSAYRLGYNPFYQRYFIGFRVVRPAQLPESDE